MNLLLSLLSAENSFEHLSQRGHFSEQDAVAVLWYGLIYLSLVDSNERLMCLFLCPHLCCPA